MTEPSLLCDDVKNDERVNPGYNDNYKIDQENIDVKKQGINRQNVENEVVCLGDNILEHFRGSKIDFSGGNDSNRNVAIKSNRNDVKSTDKIIDYGDASSNADLNESDADFKNVDDVTIERIHDIAVAPQINSVKQLGVNYIDDSNENGVGFSSDVKKIDVSCDNDNNDNSNGVSCDDDIIGNDISDDGKNNEKDVNCDSDGANQNDINHDDVDQNDVNCDDGEFDSDDETRPMLMHNPSGDGDRQQRSRVMDLVVVVFKKFSFLKKSKSNFIEAVTTLLMVNWILMFVLRSSLSQSDSRALRRIGWQSVFYIIGHLSAWICNVVYFLVHLTGLSERVKSFNISLIVFCTCFLSSIMVIIPCTALTADIIVFTGGVEFWEAHPENQNFLWSTIIFGYLGVLGLLFQTKIHFLEFQHGI